MSCKKPKKRVEILSFLGSENSMIRSMSLSCDCSDRAIEPNASTYAILCFSHRGEISFFSSSIVTTVAKMEQMAACFNFFLPNAKRSSIVKGMRGE